MFMVMLISVDGQPTVEEMAFVTQLARTRLNKETVLHIANLAFVTSDAVTNTEIRNAFGLDEKEKVKASRIIRDTLDAKLIKPVDPSTAPRYMKYVPYWA